MDPLEPLYVDVRPILARGGEPLSRILAAVDALAPGQSLIVTTPFEPVPLVSLMTGRGFMVSTEPLDNTSWALRIRRGPDPSNSELDLRDLSDDGPWDRVLEASSTLGRSESLLVHTRLRPLTLVELLEEHGFDAECQETAPGHWQTRIWRFIRP